MKEVIYNRMIKMYRVSELSEDWESYDYLSSQDCIA